MKRLKHLSLFVMLPALLLLAAAFGWPEDAAPVSADVTVGEPAPDFTLQGTDGKTYTLSDLEGQFVVLEWLNFGCPYVQRHYGSGNMPALQEQYTGEGIVWLSIVSSAPGKQGHYPPDEMNAENEKRGGKQTAILMDHTGEVGLTYGAQTTPHMYVINPEGTLLYKGGIDDQPRASQEETASVPSYVSAALDAAMNGEEVAVKAAPPYGCEIKYAAQ